MRAAAASNSTGDFTAPKESVLSSHGMLNCLIFGCMERGRLRALNLRYNDVNTDSEPARPSWAVGQTVGPLSHRNHRGAEPATCRTMARPGRRTCPGRSERRLIPGSPASHRIQVRRYAEFSLLGVRRSGVLGGVNCDPSLGGRHMASQGCCARMVWMRVCRGLRDRLNDDPPVGHRSGWLRTPRHSVPKRSRAVRRRLGGLESGGRTEVNGAWITL